MFTKYTETLKTLAENRGIESFNSISDVVVFILETLAGLIELDRLDQNAQCEILFDETNETGTPYTVRIVRPGADKAEKFGFSDYLSARYYATTNGLKIVNDCGNHTNGHNVVTQSEVSDVVTVRTAEEETLKDTVSHLVTALYKAREIKAFSFREELKIAYSDDLWRSCDALQGTLECALDRIDPDELSSWLQQPW